MLGILAFPTALGTRFVYEPILRRLEAGDFRLKVGALKLGWFSPVQVQDIEVSETIGEPLLRIKKLVTDRGLFSLLLGGGQFGRIELHNPQVDVELSNRTNIGRLIDAVAGKIPQSHKKSRANKLSLSGQLVVREMTCIVSQPGQQVPLVIVPPFNVDVTCREEEGQSKLLCGPTTLLDHVELTPELMNLGLSLAIPVLAESTWMKGKISLRTGQIEILLSDLIHSTGEAEINLHEVRSGPSNKKLLEVLDFIAKMRGRPASHELMFVEGAVVAVGMRQGRVFHTGLKFGLPKLDSRLQFSTSGSVGWADRSLQMNFAIPVPIEQLARRDIVKEMGVPTLVLPISGTLSNPKLEWSALRSESADLLGKIRHRVQEESPATASLISGLEGLADGQADQAISGAVNLLRGLSERRAASKNSKNDSSADAIDASGSEQKPAKSRPVRDAIRNILKEIP